jgi:hypothetical protein
MFFSLQFPFPRHLVISTFRQNNEIQFDYVRFPDAPGLHFPVPNTPENKVRAISDFLEETRRRLGPYNVFLAADIFGYVAWNPGDTEIGQNLEALAPHLDYISPMPYPSGFHFKADQ